MSIDIKALRKMRSGDFSKITDALEKAANPQSNNTREEDKRFWKLERDKAGNGSAVIRFLPRTEKDELPWVRIYHHGFKGPTGRWYIENSLSTIGQMDGVAELNRELWNSTEDDNHPNRKQAREQKRRLTYISNILVISDPKHPENEGKVFLFKYGKKIHDKIVDAARPTFADQEPIDVFDYWEGANFKLRMRQVDGYANYDQSVFDAPSAIGDDEFIVEVANTQHWLGEFIDPKNFKSREDLDKKLAEVMGNGKKSLATAEKEVEQAAGINSSPAVATIKEAKSTSIELPASDDDSNLADYFNTILNDEN